MFSSRQSELMVNAMSRALIGYEALPQPILDVLLFYGSKLDPNDDDYFKQGLRGMNDVVQQAIDAGHGIVGDDVRAAVVSGNCETIKLVRGAYRENVDLWWILLHNATVQSLELCLSLNIIQRGTHCAFCKIPSFSILQWILDHDVMEHNRLLIDIASNACRYSGHYFDMLRYLIEQRNFTVPRDMLVKLDLSRVTDLDVFDYLLCHGADVNTVDDHGWNVLEHSPMLIRYWIDRGFVVKSNDADQLRACVKSGMTVPVLEMMIDKYSMDINAVGGDGRSALHEACMYHNYEVVEMLIKHGADVNKRDSNEETPYEMTHDDRMKQLLISFGYKPRQ